MTREEVIEQAESGEIVLSFSALKEFSKSPKAFMDYKTKERVQTDAQAFGSLVHCLILEPKEFVSRYYVPNDNELVMKLIDGGSKNPRATKDYKEWYSERVKEAGERQIITLDSFQLAQKMKQAVMNSKAGDLIRACDEYENLIEFNYEGLNMIGYIDARQRGKYSIDLKTCRDASPDKFHRDIFNYHYHTQGACYLQAGTEREYYIIAVDQNCEVSTNKLDQESLDHGLKTLSTWMKNFKHCVGTRSFDKSHDFYAVNGIHTVNKPRWIK